MPTFRIAATPQEIPLFAFALEHGFLALGTVHARHFRPTRRFLVGQIFAGREASATEKYPVFSLPLPQSHTTFWAGFGGTTGVALPQVPAVFHGPGDQSRHELFLPAHVIIQGNLAGRDQSQHAFHQGGCDRILQFVRQGGDQALPLGC